MQAARRRVEPDVEGHLLRVQELAQALLVGALADEAPLLQGVEHGAHSPTLLYSLIACRIVAAMSAIFTRVCSIESRKRMVTVWSSLVW